MPYKDRRDRNANDTLKRRIRRLEEYREQGLEPVDPQDWQSNIVCLTCGMETARDGTGNRYTKGRRHYDGCPYQESE